MNKTRFQHFLLMLLISLLLVSCIKDTNNPVETTEIEAPTEISYQIQQAFYHYANQGNLTLSSPQPITIQLTLNQQFIGTYQLSNEPLALDVSPYTINGTNSFEVDYASLTELPIEITYDYPTLTYHPNEDTFTSEELSGLTGFIQSEIQADFPGCVVLIAQKGNILYHEAFGYQLKYDGMSTLTNWQPMTKDTLFDLASLTKAFAGSLGMMSLEQSHQVSLWDKIANYIPTYNPHITFSNLLSHTAGLPASFRFFDPNNPLGLEFYSLDKDKTLSLLPSLTLSYEPSTSNRYSDISYMVLTHLIETISEDTLDNYLETHLYNPLGLKNTLFTPLTHFTSDQFAATERNGNTRDLQYQWPEVRTHTLQGQVHDELAYYSMDEVSAHAGLFSNAYDLAVLSQMLLNKGGYGAVKLFDPEIVHRYTSASAEYSRYGYGFDMASFPNNYYRYGMKTSDLAYGKTGWTGTEVLIDPAYDLIVVFLTNKRHAPFEKGAFTTEAMELSNYSSIITRIYEMLLDQPAEEIDTTVPLPYIPLNQVELGIDQLQDYLPLFLDKRVGLITNAAAYDSFGKTTLDNLRNNVNLTTVFAPEHGYELALEAGVGSDHSQIDDMNLYSLYGNTLRPTESMLSEIDLLAFDIQDLGVRYYTYIYTMIYAMEACAKNNTEMVVFDRPPIFGDKILGAPTPYASFIGDYGLPTVYGLTIGELASYINDTYEINCKLTVIPMKNYHYDYYQDTGLEFIPPSPNMTSINSALLYPGTCLIEGTNISEGRGSLYPFQVIGAPFINPYTLANTLNNQGLDGVEFIPTSFIPESSKYTNALCYGVYIDIIDPYALNPLEIGITLLWTLRSLYSDDFETTQHLDLLAGFELEEALKQKDSLSQLLENTTPSSTYQQEITPYKLYP